MTPERWRQIERLYHDALALSVGERSAFLASACRGDDALRRDVESLLAQPQSADALLATGGAVAALGPRAVATSLIGRRLGVYEITTAIGAGGMGEVYRARDTRLGRDVAIKILPAAFTADADRLARFEREARLLAALNHPNIATIHGVEDAADGLTGLVMELVDGETLARRIARGPLPLAEALALARQIADALDAAHERGIVHRDLTPANIAIARDGHVKVLDFGLAKVEANQAGGSSTQAPTIPVDATHPGLVVGTAAYMSPEQARGQAVDKRTDIWAFGCVLYEMLTGHSTFGKSTITDTLAAIVERDPDWTALPASTPPQIARLVRRCLDKNVRRRLRDAGDARADLEEIARETSDIAIPRRHNRGRYLALAALTAILFAIGFVLLPQVRRSTTGSAASLALHRLTYDPGISTHPSLSPNGQLLAYASNRSGRGDLDIWVQQGNDAAPLRLTDDPGDDHMPDFSPDGSLIAFRSERGNGGIYVMSALGGPARLIAADGRWPRFSHDGKKLAYWTGQFRGQPRALSSAVFVVSLAGGTATRVLPDFVMARDPIWAPDDNSLLLLGRRDRTSPLSDSYGWWFVPLDGGPPIRTGVERIPGVDVGPMHLNPWTSDGVLLANGTGLWRVPLSPRDGRMAGPMVQLTAGTDGLWHPTASRAGGVVLAVTTATRVIERAPLGPDAEHSAVRLYADQGQLGGWRASETPDESLIVFERIVGKHVEIWTRDARAGGSALVARVEAPGQTSPTISADGTRVAYTVGEFGDGTAYVVDTSGGLPRMLCEHCQHYGFLSDSRRVLVTREPSREIATIDVTDSSTVELIRDGNRLDRAHVSPDDRWLAFRRVEGTASKTYVVRLTDAAADRRLTRERQVQESGTTGRPAGWSLDSHVLYLLLDTDGFRCLWGQQVNPTDGRLVGSPFAVRHFHRAGAETMSTSLGNPITAGGLLYEALVTTSNLWRLEQRPPH